jgi:hypothetical protein
MFMAPMQFLKDIICRSYQGSSVGGGLYVASKRYGVSQLTFGMKEFLDFILEQGFMDILLAGGSFTWSTTKTRPLCPGLTKF